MEYNIYAGLNGGFGGANFVCTLDFDNIDEATNYAYEESISIYEEYEGLHGLRTVSDIQEEDNISNYDDAYQIYVEERENWLDYYVEEVSEYGEGDDEDDYFDDEDEDYE